MARKYLFLSVILALGACPPAFAAGSPLKMSFQGKLLDTSNNPRNGNFDFTFRIFSAPSGGAEFWSESQSGVPVSNGVFSVALGTVTALTHNIFAGASAYLEIQVSPDAAMTPRQALLMAPYALRALIADSLTAGDTNYVQVRTSLQSGAVFHVASATVAGPFLATATSSFTATGPETFSLFASSGLRINAGTLRLESAAGLDAQGTVTAGTVTARTSLVLPAGTGLIGEGAMRWDASADVVSVGTGGGTRTLADTSSAQTLTNKTLNSTGGNTVDSTHLRTRLLDSAAPSEGMTLEWDGGASAWAPVHSSTLTIVVSAIAAGAGRAMPAAGVIRVTPVAITGTLKVNQMRLRVTAIQTATGDIGIYDTNGNLMVSGGTSSVDFGGTAGARVINVLGAPKTLQPGQYYYAIVHDGATPPSITMINLAAASAGVIKGLGNFTPTPTITGTTLPATITLGGIVDGFEVPFMSAHE